MRPSGLFSAARQDSSSGQLDRQKAKFQQPREGDAQDVGMVWRKDTWNKYDVLSGHFFLKITGCDTGIDCMISLKKYRSKLLKLVKLGYFSVCVCVCVVSIFYRARKHRQAILKNCCSLPPKKTTSWSKTTPDFTLRSKRIPGTRCPNHWGVLTSVECEIHFETKWLGYYWMLVGVKVYIINKHIINICIIIISSTYVSSSYHQHIIIISWTIHARSFSVNSWDSWFV